MDYVPYNYTFNTDGKIPGRGEEFPDTVFESSRRKLYETKTIWKEGT